MNARAKAQQIEMINPLQQVILTAFSTSREVAPTDMPTVPVQRQSITLQVTE